MHQLHLLFALYAFLCLSFPRCLADSSFFEIKINDIRGKPIDFQQFQGKAVLIANVASQCGYTQSGYA
jgi:glutathione peroxidase